MARHSDKESNSQKQDNSESLHQGKIDIWETRDLTGKQERATHQVTDQDKKLSEGLTVRLDSETLALLRNQAREKGIGPTTLIRMWIFEKLKGKG